MKRLIILLLALGLLGAVGFALARAARDKVEEVVTPVATEDVVSAVLAARMRELEEGSLTDLGSADKINVLLLGLDARKGDDHPHCDAIHFFTLDLKKGTMHITTVPRGTYAYIPGRHAASEYYLSNSCALEGIDYGIKQMEKVSGIHADYVIKVGFSEVVGILRAFDLPTTSTLQWLRHRQSYKIGEPQRSHNQAVFMKDMIVGHLDRFRGDFGLPMQYLLYQTIDTDMEFGVARALLRVYLDDKIDEHPERITLEMKPAYEVVDYHLDVENSEAQIQALVDYLKPFLSKEDLSLKSMESIQAELLAYILNRLDSEEPVVDMMQKQLWLQIEDDSVREDMHYRLVERQIVELELTDHQAAIDAAASYVLEMETLGLDDWVAKGKVLLEPLLTQ